MLMDQNKGLRKLYEQIDSSGLFKNSSDEVTILRSFKNQIN